MLAALALELCVRLRRALSAALTAFVVQPPRDRLFAVVVLLAVAIDVGIPLVTLGCLSWGGCPLLRP